MSGWVGSNHGSGKGRQLNALTRGTHALVHVLIISDELYRVRRVRQCSSFPAFGSLIRARGSTSVTLTEYGRTALSPRLARSARGALADHGAPSRVAESHLNSCETSKKLETGNTCNPLTIICISQSP